MKMAVDDTHARDGVVDVIVEDDVHVDDASSVGRDAGDSPVQVPDKFGDQ